MNMVITRLNKIDEYGIKSEVSSLPISVRASRKLFKNSGISSSPNHVCLPLGVIISHISEI